MPMTEGEKLDLLRDIDKRIAESSGELRLVCNALRERIEKLEARAEGDIVKPGQPIRMEYKDD